MNLRISFTAQAHSIINGYINTGDIVIDATVGNGHDTLYLSQQVGPEGFVFGFDIQQKALDATQTRLINEKQSDNVKLCLGNHSNIDILLPTEHHRQIKTIVFNLGYLPGSDKSILTESKSTLTALNKSIKLLVKNGIISIIVYPGHPAGAIENNDILKWSKLLTSKEYSVKIINSSEKPTAPKLFIIQKLC